VAEKMNKIFCFGELLLRMNPALKGEWINQGFMPVYIGGAELNVATALAKWELPVKYCTALPDNYLAKEVVESIRQRKMDDSAIHFSGNRIGIYYLPQGADLKNTGVIYDRAYSSFAELSPGVINWEEVLKGCSWFHFSAISPALNKNAAAVCMEALYFASQKKMTISVDLNYRSRLWQFEKKPIQVMPELVKYCQVVMGNIWSAETLLGIPVDTEIHKRSGKKAYIDHARQTAKAIMGKFPACKTVASTFRFDQGAGIKYYAALDNKEEQFVSPEFFTQTVVDKVGSGDCFMAGLIYGLYHRSPAQDTINYAAAAAFGKLQERGDATGQTVDAVKKILSGL
jgi:2-dehydro-3-deoxygluconokinase